MARTKDETLREITLDYLAKINVQNPPTPANIQADILDATNLQFQLENLYQILLHMLELQLAIN